MLKYLDKIMSVCIFKLVLTAVLNNNFVIVSYYEARTPQRSMTLSWNIVYI